MAILNIFFTPLCIGVAIILFIAYNTLSYPAKVLFK